MSLNKVGIGLVLAMGLFLSVGLARADQQELQIGYVLNTWSSNSLFRGSEQRVPLGYYFSSPNLTLSLNTAFVAGDYMEDAAAAAGITGSEYQSSQFSDTTLGVNWGLDMGGSMRSNLRGTLNIPTGDNHWEVAEQTGAIPVIFEPSFYHGGGWGGNLFYSLSISDSNSQYGVGFGYMSTSVYNTGISAEGTFSPGDNVVALATLGFRVSGTESLGFRVVHTFPVESTYANPVENFTEGQATVLSSQWISQMGKDKLVINASYSFYNAGFTAQTTGSNALAQDPGPYFGDRLEIHPIFGYSLGTGVVMETGLTWDFIQPNGFSQNPPVGAQYEYVGGGNLLGAEQSITFQLSPETFLNFAGLYHDIANNNAGVNNQTITYQRFTLGTNVGLKW